MKGLLLSAAFTLLYAVVITVALRRFDVRARAALLTRVFLISTPILLGVHLVTPGNLGFLPANLVEPDRWADLGFTVLLYFAGFFGGVLQLYNLADRGLSLRMLIDVDESRTGTLDVTTVMSAYGGGKGINWMYEKRLTGMLEYGLIEAQGDYCSLTSRGLRIAKIYRSLRALLRLEHAPGR